MQSTLVRAPGAVALRAASRNAFRQVTKRGVQPVRASIMSNMAVQAAVGGLPTEVLIAGGAVVALAVGGLALFAGQDQNGGTIWKAGRDTSAQEKAPERLPRENAVLVIGATGRMGRVLVQSLLAQGRTVVAAVRSVERAKEVFSGMGVTEGRQAGGKGILFLEGGVDVTNPDTLSPFVFTGVSQVVTAVGAVFGRTAEGQMGYLDDMTPERVDAAGMANVAAAAAKYLAPAQRATEGVVRMRSAEDLAKWQRLDDVIMGGQSASGLTAMEDGTGCVWNGELITEGGGFCGARSTTEALDLSSFDGVYLRVKSDAGQTFKLNIKTDAQTDVPEDTYQAAFETSPNGDWTSVYIPWHEFVLVKRAKTVPNGPPLDPARIRQFGLVLSRFSFNGFPNPNYTTGTFELAINGGIRAYKDTRPQLIMVSSAGVERNALIGNDEEARKADIPIVQLNPGGVLNHKYTGENAVRASGLSYCVLRPVGLVDESEPGDFLLEASQGDRITGRISREELSSVVAAALGLPAAANKTVELRRGEATDAKGKKMAAQDNLRLFLGAVEDRHRQRIGLAPFPAPVPPPVPVTEERKKEILEDVRVVKSMAAGRGGRVRDEKEAAEAGSITVTNDGREKTAPAAAPASGAAPANVEEARAWIAAWKAQQGGNGDESDAEVPANVREAREWIRKWRASTLEKKLPQSAEV